MIIYSFYKFLLEFDYDDEYFSCVFDMFLIVITYFVCYYIYNTCWAVYPAYPLLKEDEFF